MRAKGRAAMSWSGERIAKLRHAYGEKQDEFCLRLRSSVMSLRHWEQDKGEPLGPVQELLDRLEEDLRKGEKRPLPMAVA
jgi:DNA-binding transcriptional regulator YiaG